MISRGLSAVPTSPDCPRARATALPPLSPDGEGSVTTRARRPCGACASADRRGSGTACATSACGRRARTRSRLAHARVHLVGRVARLEVRLARHRLGHVHGRGRGTPGVELPERLARGPARAVEVVDEPDDVVLHALELARWARRTARARGCGRPTCRRPPGSRRPCRRTGWAAPARARASSTAQPWRSPPPRSVARRDLHVVEGHLALPREEAGQPRGPTRRARARRRAAGSRPSGRSPVRTATMRSRGRGGVATRRASCRRDDSRRCRRCGVSVTPCGPHEALGSVMATESTARRGRPPGRSRAPLRRRGALHQDQRAEHARGEERARERAAAQLLVQHGGVAERAAAAAVLGGHAGCRASRAREPSARGRARASSSDFCSATPRRPAPRAP